MFAKCLNIVKAQVQIWNEAVAWGLKKAKDNWARKSGWFPRQVHWKNALLCKTASDMSYCVVATTDNSYHRAEFCHSGCSWRQSLFVSAKILSYQDKRQSIKSYRKISLPDFLHYKRLKILPPQRVFTKNQERFGGVQNQSWYMLEKER